MEERVEDTYKLRVYLDVMKGGYRWVLRSGKGETLARSSRRYARKAMCLCDLESVKTFYPGVVIRDLTARSAEGGGAGS